MWKLAIFCIFAIFWWSLWFSRHVRCCPWEIIIIADNATYSHIWAIIYNFDGLSNTAPPSDWHFVITYLVRSSLHNSLVDWRPAALYKCLWMILVCTCTLATPQTQLLAFLWTLKGCESIVTYLVSSILLPLPTVLHVCTSSVGF